MKDTRPCRLRDRVCLSEAEREEGRKEGEGSKKVERRLEQERGICIASRAARMEGRV